MMLNSPFLKRSITTSLLKSNKFTFNSLVTNLEKTVSTINQVIPLYNQVKPLISTSKNVFSKAKDIIKVPKNNQRNSIINNQNNVINVEPVEVKNENKKEEKVMNTINITTPQKPFFI
jgi:hypothetical protein